MSIRRATPMPNAALQSNAGSAASISVPASTSFAASASSSYARQDDDDEESAVLLRGVRGAGIDAYTYELYQRTWQRWVMALVCLCGALLLALVYVYHCVLFGEAFAAGSASHSSDTTEVQTQSLAQTPVQTPQSPSARSFVSTLSPALDVCWRNPLLAHVQAADVESYEAHYSTWWDRRSATLTRVLTDYYFRGPVHPDNVEKDDYSSLKRDRVGDRFVELMYDSARAWPCPFPETEAGRTAAAANKGYDSLKAHVCGLPIWEQLVAKQQQRFPDMYAGDQTVAAAPASPPVVAHIPTAVRKDVGSTALESAQAAAACVVYSAGAATQELSVEDAISSGTACSLYRFDCTWLPNTSPGAPLKRMRLERDTCFGEEETNAGESKHNLQVRMFPVANTPANWRSPETCAALESAQYKPFGSVASRLAKEHGHHVTAMVIDVEDEWRVIQSILADPQRARRLAPFQILLKMHWWNRGMAAGMLSLDMLNLLYRNGYRVSWHETLEDTNNFTVLFVRAFC